MSKLHKQLYYYFDYVYDSATCLQLPCLAKNITLTFTILNTLEDHRYKTKQDFGRHSYDNCKTRLPHPVALTHISLLLLISIVMDSYA